MKLFFDLYAKRKKKKWDEDTQQRLQKKLKEKKTDAYTKAEYNIKCTT